MTTLSEVPLFRPVVVRFADDVSGRTFASYTDGQLWNGLVCPHLPIGEFRRVLDALLEGSDDPHYTVIDDQHVRVNGRAGVADTFVMAAKYVATTDGNRWLFDCGGVWRFVEIPIEH